MDIRAAVMSVRAAVVDIRAVVDKYNAQSQITALVCRLGSICLPARIMLY